MTQPVLLTKDQASKAIMSEMKAFGFGVEDRSWRIDLARAMETPDAERTSGQREWVAEWFAFSDRLKAIQQRMIP